MDGPILLDEIRFTLPEVARLSGIQAKNVRNWLDRGMVDVGPRQANGRHRFSLLDAVRLAALADLTGRVLMGPSDAVSAAEVFVRQVLAYAPRDGAGRPIADLSAMPQNLALIFAAVDGEQRVGLIDADQPGYAEAGTERRRAHVVLPIAPLVADVLFKFLEMETAR